MSTNRNAMSYLTSQERQRLETILSLCSELGRAERDGGGTAQSSTSAVADLQKINQELEKLQVNDDEDDDTPSVFSDSSAVNGTTGNGHMTSPGSENGYYDDDLQVRQRRSSGHRDYRAESPAVSLRSFAPSPSPRLQRTHEVYHTRRLFTCSLEISSLLYANIDLRHMCTLSLTFTSIQISVYLERM